MARNYRTRMGADFSEGARLLWLVVERRDYTMRRLRDEIGGGFDVTRWLYGDVVPPLKAVVRIQELFRIPPSAWLKKTPEAAAFVPPAARPAKTGTEG